MKSFITHKQKTGEKILPRIFTPLFAGVAIVGAFFLLETSLAQTSSFSIGSRIQTTSNLTVRNTPGGTSAGVQKGGSIGVIAEGPVVRNGYTWWRIDYETNPDGWSAQNWLYNVTNDTTPPLLTSIRSSFISSRYAYVSWSTNEYSHTEVEYGLTSAYGQSHVLNKQTKLHGIGLSSLSPSTTYHYRVRSRDAAGNISVSGNFTFTTASTTRDVTPPSGTISSPSLNRRVRGVIDLTTSAFDNVRVASVQFRVNGQNVGERIFTSPYTTRWDTGTVTNGIHAITAAIEDSSGNSITTPSRNVTVDNTPPSVSGIPTVSSTALTSVKILWNTNESSTAQVEYGTSQTYGSTTPQSTILRTSHSVTFSNLIPNTTYQYRLRLRDTLGNETVSGNYTFNTPSVSTKFVPQDVVYTTSNLNVRSYPRLSYSPIGTQSLGASGAVLSGPTYADGYWWWRVNYASGADGWSVENYMERVGTSPPNASSSSTTVPGPITFSRAYRGASTLNVNYQWSWEPPTSGGAVHYYEINSDWGDNVLWGNSLITTSTSYIFREGYNATYLATSTRVIQPGPHYFRVRAVNDAGSSVAVDDAFTAVAGVGHGANGIVPYFSPGSEPNNIVNLRYKVHFKKIVAHNGNKIIFGTNRLFSSSTGGYHGPLWLAANWFLDSRAYTDPTCANNPAVTPGVPVSNKASVWLGIGDVAQTGMIGGIKTFSPTIFPRLYWNIDLELRAPEFLGVSQIDVSEKDIEINVTRGEIITDRSGWRCGGELLSATTTYREWNITATIDGTVHRVALALPDSLARFISPLDMLGLRTEFFAGPGTVKIYYWDLQFQREGSSTTWQSINTWRVNEVDGRPVDSGFKIGTHNGRNVLEVSNDAPNNYAPLGGIISL